ncbi:uncharacterized protein RSE6_14346 [Rhynchosporium secalis]|uniref:Uncharacterized protein n=1 Tax=Rhynchosporium secalis TaxID=38038 RepID=A0A1E1MV25_RHYSE|nr:uncharacterized protein RSE6_14346 [Rhynchosporium secalis]
MILTAGRVSDRRLLWLTETILISTSTSTSRDSLPIDYACSLIDPSAKISLFASVDVAPYSRQKEDFVCDVEYLNGFKRT